LLPEQGRKGVRARATVARAGRTLPCRGGRREGPSRGGALNTAAQLLQGGKAPLSRTEGGKGRVTAEFFVVGRGGKEQYRKARVEGLEAGKAEVGKQEVVGGKFLPESGNKFPAPYARRGAVPAGAYELNLGRECFAQPGKYTGRGGTKAGLIFRAETDEHPEASCPGTGVKRRPPLYRQFEQGGQHPVGRTALRPGKKVEEKVKGRTKGPSFINTQYRREGSPMAVFFRGSPEAVKDDQVPVLCSPGRRKEGFPFHTQGSKYRAGKIIFRGRNAFKREKGFHAEFPQFKGQVS
jgi:hypothetical protein